MMYIVFLAFLYKLQGGSFISFVRAALGYDVEADKTPATPAKSGNDAFQKGQRRPVQQSIAATTGYASDGAASNSSAPGDETTSLASRGLLTSSGGGTFSGSYERLPSWGGDGDGGDEETGGGGDISGDKIVRRSISVNSDGGEYGGGSGARSLSISSDIIPATSDGEDLPVGPVKKRGPKSGRKSRLALGAGRGGGRQGWGLSMKDRQVLKRRTVLARLTPIVLLSSFVNDLDLVTDWTFLKYGLAGAGEVITQLALLFAVVGTVMWALSATEFSLMSKLKNMWKGNPLSRLQHVGLGWQLLANVILEDAPQFVITVITKPTSVTGVLNLCSSGLSLCAKVVHGISSQRAPSLSTQFKMIDQDPAVTRNLFKLRDEAKKQAASAEKLVELAWINRCCVGEKKAAAVYQVLQIDPTLVNGELEYMRADLLSGSKLYITHCCLTGPIPSKLGDLKILQIVVLSANHLSGAIPTELGNLVNLKELSLNENALTGPIPVELSQLSSLMVLNLSQNALTGPIPSELSGLSMLTLINLSCNELSGEIPRGLSKLSALQELDLSHNQLTGPIPKVFGARLHNLRTLRVGNNMLTGRVPMSLERLTQLKSLDVGNNMLSAAEDTEDQLKRNLHPECSAVFHPQEEPEEEPAEESDPELQTEDLAA
ncbi:unnamed protein product [Pylaiella littoralis]